MDATVLQDIRCQRRAAPDFRLAYNLGNFVRALATPEPIKNWSLTSPKKKLIKIGAKAPSPRAGAGLIMANPQHL